MQSPPGSPIPPTERKQGPRETRRIARGLPASPGQGDHGPPRSLPLSLAGFHTALFPMHLSPEPRAHPGKAVTKMNRGDKAEALPLFQGSHAESRTRRDQGTRNYSGGGRTETGDGGNAVGDKLSGVPGWGWTLSQAMDKHILYSRSFLVSH